MKRKLNLEDIAHVMHVFKQEDVTARRYFILLPSMEIQTYLTKSEAKIISLMIQGKRPKQIAWELCNSMHTINSHIANIKEKLNCVNNFQLGYRLGWFHKSVDCNNLM